MSQTLGFEYDIFISYAHNDDHVLSGDKGWVTQFHELLSNWLVKLRGQKDLKIWFDQNHLGGNTRFDDAIKNGIESSALFFVIHSRNYQNSQYCNQELDWFLEHNERYRNGVRVGDESRLFNIQIQNIHFDTWSEKLAGTSGFVMHDAEENEPGFPISPADNRLFEKHMRKVVEATEKTLGTLSAQAPKPKREAPKDNNTPKIFIANVPDTLKSFRKQLINEIGNKATILDNLPPPFPAAEHIQQLQNTLDQSSLSIHLLDQFSGMEIHDAIDGSTYPQVQADTARKRSQRSLIWVPDSLNKEDIEEQAQANWLDELENGQRQASGFHFVRSTRQAFIGQVNQVLDELLGQQAVKVSPSRFLIDTHQKDQRLAYKVAGILANHEIDVEFNKESSNPEKSQENFEQSVREAKHLIIMFGQVTPKWVAGRIHTALKVFVEQMQHTDPILEGIWIYMLPCCPGEKTLPRVPPLIKLNCLDNSTQDDIDETVIQTLLNSQGGL